MHVLVLVVPTSCCWWQSQPGQPQIKIARDRLQPPQDHCSLILHIVWELRGAAQFWRIDLRFSLIPTGNRTPIQKSEIRKVMIRPLLYSYVRVMFPLRPTRRSPSVRWKVEIEKIVQCPSLAPIKVAKHQVYRRKDHPWFMVCLVAAFA